MYYNLTWIYGSKELACTVRHEVLKGYFISQWNINTKENKQVIKKYKKETKPQLMNNSKQKAVYDFAILPEVIYFGCLCKYIFLRKYLKEPAFAWQKYVSRKN